MKQSAEAATGQAALRRIQGYVGVLLKRKWTIIVVTGLVVALVLGYTSRQKPVFRATATLIIDRAPPQLLSGVKEVIELGSTNYWAIKDYLRTQYEIIRSREVGERVVDRLNLRGDRRFASAGEDLSVPGGRPGADPVALVLDKIRVEPLKDSLLVYIHAEDTDPAFATDLANAVAEAYRDHNLQSKKHIIIEAQRDLVKLVDRLRQEKDDAERALHTFETDHNIGSLENQQRIIDGRIEDYTRKLNSVSIRRLELESKRKQLAQYRKGRSVFSVAYANVLDNPLIVTMKQRHIELEDKLAQLRVTYLEKHPKVTAVERQLRRIEREIRREVANLLQSVEDEYQEVLETETALLGKLEEAKTDERALNAVKSDYEPLVQRFEEASKFYGEVLYRQTETTLTAQSTMNNVRIHDLAVEPISPVRPNWRVAAAIALLLGLMGGTAFAFLREFLDSTVKTREDVEETTGLSLLGVMPPMDSDGKGRGGYGYGYKSAGSDEEDEEIVHPALRVHYRKQSIAAERTRTIRTNLLFMMPGRELQTVLITSPNPQEGKTTVAVNTAIAMAQGGSRTVLIDMDLRRPRVHSAFGLDSESGLSSAVIGSDPIESYIVPSVVPNLDVLRCGPVPPEPTALLHSERMREIMRQIRERYDMAIIDSPPVLPVTDAMIVANEADGVLIVVRSDRTSRDALAHATRELKQVNANILGCVLNHHEVARRGYGHYKYYGNRYYRRGDADESRKSVG